MLALAALAVVVALVWGVARLGAALVADAAAQSAADAAALAGAVEGRPAAVEAAQANRAELVEWREQGRLVQVVVARQGQRARATAEWLEGPAEGPPLAPGPATPPP